MILKTKSKKAAPRNTVIRKKEAEEIRMHHHAATGRIEDLRMSNLTKSSRLPL